MASDNSLTNDLKQLLNSSDHERKLIRKAVYTNNNEQPNVSGVGFRFAQGN